MDQVDRKSEDVVLIPPNALMDYGRSKTNSAPCGRYDDDDYQISYYFQSLVFRVLRHPHVPEFEQCVSFDAFSSQQQELVYNVFCLCAMYFLPLLIITVCYGCIFYEISKNSKEISGQYSLIVLCRNNQICYSLVSYV